MPKKRQPIKKKRIAKKPRRLFFLHEERGPIAGDWMETFELNAQEYVLLKAMIELIRHPKKKAPAARKRSKAA